MKRTAKPKTPTKTYKQFVLFPELWGGMDYVEIKVKARRKRSKKQQPDKK